MQKFEADYDYENDNLFITKKGVKSTGSVEISGINLDFYKNELVAIEITDASEFFKISKLFLRNIMKSKFEVTQKNNWLFIRLFIMLANKELEKDLSIPNIIEPSPALAYT